MPGFGSRGRRKSALSRKQKAKKHKEENQVDDRDRPENKKKVGYDDIVKENKSYERYYKTQNIVPEEEWDLFMSTLRENLPAAFRITGYFGGQAKALLQIVEGDYFQSLVISDPKASKEGSVDVPNGAVIPALKCLPWYPNRLGWQLKLSRVEIRRSESSLKLHNFLISESESGYINRQEAVSMLPPLLLDVQPHHKVLDMCAAPGSKTAQVIEMLHSEDGKSFAMGSGVIVANDIDNRRCYMLVHQAKRLHSPCSVITNHDAGVMPSFYEEKDGKRTVMKFDRILCDAPCTGDGTIRKNYDIWMKWNVANGNNFHGIQARIVKRGAEMLAKDGIIVYSTCSLNPMEDESVIASLLNMAEGGLELIDISDKVPGLKYSPGLEEWVVMTKDHRAVRTVDELDEKQKTQIRESMFAPSNAKELNLKRCIRVLPHQQDTGGFFVAVMRKKVDTLPWERQTPREEGDEQQASRSPPRKKHRGFKEDPFFFFNQNDEEWHPIKKFYKINDQFPYDQLMYRSATGKKRNIYFLTKSAKKIITDNFENIKFINAGARLFARNVDKEAECGFRLSQEGLPSVLPFIDPNNIIALPPSDVEKLLALDSVHFEKLSDDTAAGISKLLPGSCILMYKKKLQPAAGEEEGEEIVVPICAWKGKTTLRPYIAKNERIHFLRVCGIDTTALEAEWRLSHEEKQERRAQKALEGKKAVDEDEKDIPEVEETIDDETPLETSSKTD